MLFTINFSICFTWPIITYFIAGHRRHQQAVNNPQPMVVLLNNPIYLKAYLSYCVKEFAIEQPLFYVDMIEFNRKFAIMTQKEQEDTTLVIFLKYFMMDSVLQLNVPQNIMAEIETRIQSKGLAPDIFKAAFDHILELMQYDSWSRFIQSSDYRLIALLEL